MNRRDFTKSVMSLGAAVPAESAEDSYLEPAKKLPARRFDVVVAGGGTAGVIAAIAAARQGAKTMLVERKGYVGGTVVEGGTALHSYYNLWKPFPGVAKRNVVRGIPMEIVDRLPQDRRHLRLPRDAAQLRLRFCWHRHRHRDVQARRSRDARRSRRLRGCQHAACGGRAQGLARRRRDYRKSIRPRGRFRQGVGRLHRLRRPLRARRRRVLGAERLRSLQQHGRRQRQRRESMPVAQIRRCAGRLL